jgi:hypothetical protein
MDSIFNLDHFWYEIKTIFYNNTKLYISETSKYF